MIKRKKLFFSAMAMIGILGLSQTHGIIAAEEILPKPDSRYEGRLGMVPEESTPGWPERIQAPAGAPNILLIMTDDEGFGTSSTFGGAVPRPTLDRLAEQGLRYNRFHVESICSPARAALLTGRNPHAVATGTAVELATPYPGQWMTMPRSAASIARVLRDNGYNTAMIGKEHNVPVWERSAAGPFEHWPNARGFEYFFGFVAADTDQWNPSLYQNTNRVKASSIPEGETLDHLLASEAIRWIHEQRAAHSGKPFFMYFATGTPHAPHQAPADWIARFKGKFDQGWDRLREETFARQKAMGVIPGEARLSARPAEIPAWDTLSADERRAAARMMEVFAATVAYQDAQLGRLIAELERMGELDNTLVMVITGDNGASGDGGMDGFLNEIGDFANGVEDSTEQLLANLDAMGGPRTYQNYPAGWALAMNTPFPWTKQVGSHLGSNRNGLVISWPRGIRSRGEVRSQFTSVTDVYPTLLEVSDIARPVAVDGITQQPVDGVSMAFSFDDAVAPERHDTKFFESLGNRAIYHKGWWASTVPQRLPWEYMAPQTGVEDYPWQLFNLTEDYSQTHDLAAQEPQKLRELRDLWLREARRNNALPVDNRYAGDRSVEMAKWLATGRTRYTYWGKGIQVDARAAPNFIGKSYRVVAEVDIPENDANGVIAAFGSWFGGWSFYLKDGQVRVDYVVSTHPGDQFRVASSARVPAGKVSVGFEFTPDGTELRGGGVVRIMIDDREVAKGRVERTIVVPAPTSETFDIGFDTATPVTDIYEGEGGFSGEIRRLDVLLGT